MRPWTATALCLFAWGCDQGGDPVEPGGQVEVPAGEAGFEPGAWAARRLTRDQFVYLVQDVLEVELTPDQQDLLPREVPAAGFTSHGVALVTTTQHIEGLWALSEGVVDRANLGQLTRRHAPCRTDEPPCIDGFVRDLGGRLFRRPVRDDEVARYRQVFDAARAEDADFDEAAGWALQAMLQGPGVLYQLVDRPPDVDGLRVLTDHELAARVALVLRRSEPDAELRAAADAGALRTSEQLAPHVDRLLESMELSRTSTRFARDWLLLDRLQGLQRADAPSGTADRLREAALRSWAHHVHVRQSAVFDVLDSPWVAVHPQVAAWYDVDPPPGWTVTEVDDPLRTGALTWPGVLTSTADRDLGGLVARGLFIREHLRCQSELHPPDGLDLTPFTSHLGPDATEREYAEDRLASDDCAGCHRQFDPLAFGLEVFDGLGRYHRENHAGRPLRTDGFVPSRSGDIPYADPAELGAVLAADPQVQRCVTSKHLAFALGRPLTSADRVALDQIHDRAMSDGGSLHAILRAVVLHPVFRVISDEGGE